MSFAARFSPVSNASTAARSYSVPARLRLSLTRDSSQNCSVVCIVTTGWSTRSLLSAAPCRCCAILGRYTHRVAISNHRLLAFDQERVTFRWKDYAHGGKQGLSLALPTLWHIDDRDSEIYRCRTISMHLLRFFLALRSLARPGCAKAHRCIRVCTLARRPLCLLSTDTRAALYSTAHPAHPPFSRPLTKLLRPKLLFKSHSAPHPPQTPAASS